MMIVEKAFGEYTDFRIPGIVATEKKTLLRYCECRKAQSDWAEIDLKISRSEDKGKNWITVALIQGHENTLNNPVMFVDGDLLVFLYCKNYKEIWKCVSTDDGKSFGAAERVDFEKGIKFFYNVVALGPGHGIKHKGRLIVPVWFAYNKEHPLSHRPSFVSTLYSDNHGTDWKIGEIIYKDQLNNPSECALAVNARDEVIISIRHEGSERVRALARSIDGISSWHNLHYNLNLPDPICMGSMAYHDGIIYHINCDSMSTRQNLTVKISNNDFESFQKIVVSDIGGYADIALLANKIYVVYEKTVPRQSGCEPFCLYFDEINMG